MKKTGAPPGLNPNDTPAINLNHEEGYLSNN